MRSSVVVCFVAACTYTDVTKSIGLVPHDLPPDLVAYLAEAGRCWNERFNVHFVSGPDALTSAQHVDVVIDETTCLDAPAQLQAGWPETLAMCPLRYWPALEPGLQPFQYEPFRVISHELGHVLNIIEHPDDPFAVMRSGSQNGDAFFHAADIQLFEAANVGFDDAHPPCVDLRRESSSCVCHD